MQGATERESVLSDRLRCWACGLQMGVEVTVDTSGIPSSHSLRAASPPWFSLSADDAIEQLGRVISPVYVPALLSASISSSLSLEMSMAKTAAAAVSSSIARSSRRHGREESLQ
jgi:hypothetical protein